MTTTVSDPKPPWGRFTARRITALVLCTLFGISGINHGLFEAMQGWKPTGGLVVQAIGAAQRMWPHGTEEALTVVPNFLITGILAMCAGIAMIVWSISFLHKKHGTLMLLLLFTMLFLVGGGIAQVLFFLPTWAYSTRINKPLRWWKRILSGGAGKRLSSIWKWSLSACCLFFLLALEIAVFGFFPGITNQYTLLYVCWGSLALSWILMNASFVSGFAYDIAGPIVTAHCTGRGHDKSLEPTP